MGCKNACFRNNPQNEITSGDNELKADYDLQTSKPLFEEAKEERPLEVEVEAEVDFKTEIDPTPVQCALRGYLFRKNFEPKLKEFQDHKFIDIEKIYEKLEASMQELIPSEIFEIEKNLASLHIGRPEDNVSVIEREPVKLDDGTIYSGEWNRDGKMHGIGTIITTDGSKITGAFQNGELNGQGRKIDSDGLMVEGEFKGGLPEGQGKMIRKDGAKFQGNFENGKITGKGKEEWQDGVNYSGEYRDGERHGKGKLETKDGSYSGKFKKGKIHGKGKFTWKNGNSYKGNWRNNMMDGTGTFKWNDGRVYQGEWKKDQRHGKGIMTWADGREYDGDWKNGNFDGIGKIKYVNSLRAELAREGEWKEGVRIKWLSE
jgi:hypothetical protein